jgi:hypothetical protein
MGTHSRYGKSLMSAVVGSEFRDWGSSVEVNYGCGSSARIDGVIGVDVAVEIESRVSKQVRGAVCDLIFHPYPKKLLVIVPVHMTDAEICAEQCRTILRRFISPNDFRVVVLTGSGFASKLDADAATVREAVTSLRKETPTSCTHDTKSNE